MNTKTKTKLCAHRLQVLSAVLLLFAWGARSTYAQTDCFTYADEGNTTITGLTFYGQSATTLTIPATVKTVMSGAFSSPSSSLNALTIDDGNPVFESDLFGTGISHALTKIDMGSKMTVANMVSLLTSIGTGSIQGSVTASGFTRESSDANPTWTTIDWTNAKEITLPAELVPSTTDQPFGSATVKGRFTIDKEIISFCTNATFFDSDDGSNMLFYVADEIADDGRLHIQRVWYVDAGKGVLIHRTKSDYGSCDLQRVESIPSNDSDNDRYKDNMLVGVTTDTKIDASEEKKTNYILKDGAFHPTSGGTIKANRAYLQIPTTAARGGSLFIDFPDEETGMAPVQAENLKADGGDEWYTISGCKLNAKPTARGLYIKNGKKYIIK